jgi:hypothetical protein
MKKRSLSLNLMLTLMMGFVFTALTGVPLAVGQVISFGTAMMPRPTGVALDALNIADLNASLGAYLRENRDVLIAEVLLDTGFEDKFEVMDDVKDEVPLPRLT